MRGLSIIGVVAVLLSLADFASSAIVKSRKKATRFDLAVEIDSVNWLRERYCDMLAYDKGRSRQTLRHLQTKFNGLPPQVRDSLLKSHYDAIVKLFEEERNNRAYAFADCYYALADEDDENLGTLYLNDIVLSIEESDTVKLRNKMILLERYARRNNLDYDSELADAEINMQRLRHRAVFDAMPLDQFTKAGFWAVDLTDFKEDYLNWIQYIPMRIELAKYGNSVHINRYSAINKPKKDGYAYKIPAIKSECYGYDTDLKTKTMYCVWGNEKTKSANPMLLAEGRRTVQHTHAMVSGELAKKKYSYAERVGGNLAVSVVDIGLNSLFDWLSVTTEHFFRCELSLTLTQPYLLEGILVIAETKVKSNDLNNAKTRKACIPLKYYRMAPEYGYCSMVKGRPVYSSWMDAKEYEKLIDIFKQERVLCEKKWAEDVKQWKIDHPGEQSPYLDKFEDQYNYEIIKRLKARAENSLMTHPLTKPDDK